MKRMRGSGGFADHYPRTYAELCMWRIRGFIRFEHSDPADEVIAAALGTMRIYAEHQQAAESEKAEKATRS